MQLEDFDTEDGPKRWVYMMTKQKSIEFVVGNVHRELSTMEGILNMMEEKKTTSGQLNHLLFWMGSLEAYVDYLLWLFNAQIMYPHSIFQGHNVQKTESAAKRIKLSDGNQEATASSTEAPTKIHP